MAKMTMVQALNLALRQEMERDNNVVLLGQDIGPDGGVFRVTDSLIDTFGKEPGRPTLTIKELVTACKWNKVEGGKARGNSRARNTLRRLVRSSWVGHPEDVGDGLYRLTTGGANRIRRLKPKPAKSKETSRAAS